MVHYSDILGSDEWGLRDAVEGMPEAPRFMALHAEAYIFGEELIPKGFPANMPAGSPPEERDRLREVVKLQRKVPLAFWTLSQQPISVMEGRRADRASRRRLEKASSPLAISTVRTVDLRRIVHRNAKAGEGVEQEWSHRWIVNGHWRNQWLPSRECHRLQWIHAYVKGPDDRPLVVKKTINRLVR